MFGSRLEVKRFEEDIKKYEARPVVTGKVLFYGHSLFTRCSFIFQECHPELPLLEQEVRKKDGSQAVVNHGFGSSSADDLLYYYDRMVRPYAPCALVMAVSDNDAGYGYSPAEIINIQARIIDWFQADFPDSPVYCFTWNAYPKYKDGPNRSRVLREEYDQLLEGYCARKSGVTCVRLVDQPFYYEDPADVGDYDKIREDIFTHDRVHFTPEGYGYFMDFIREFLEKEGLL